MPTTSDIAVRTGLSEAAVSELKDAIARGGGRQAQFNHPELGGLGQWQGGGQVMVGDMFNRDLAARVGLACSLIAESQPAVSSPPQQNWWPADLGSPSQSAAQNAIEYATFPQRHRLAVRRQNAVEVYDTGDLVVQGVAAQDGTLFVTSATGRREIGTLRRVS